jgi:hypothetical protein
VLNAGQTGEADIEAAIDNLFNHPNVGPFIGKQLIQLLVTSNPSAAYIERVSTGQSSLDVAAYQRWAGTVVWCASLRASHRVAQYRHFLQSWFGFTAAGFYGLGYALTHPDRKGSA